MPHRQLCYPRRTWLFVFLLTLLFNPNSTKAADAPWQSTPLTADPKALYEAAAAATSGKSVDVVVLNEVHRFTYDTEGKQTYTSYLVYMILTQKGAEGWDRTTVYWEPWHEEAPAIRARVIGKDFESHLLSPKTIADVPARDEQEQTYGDRRVMRAPFPAIGPGVVVEEETTLREKSPFFAAGRVTRVYFGRRVPVQRLTLEIESPASLPLHYETALLPHVKMERAEANGQVTLSFEEDNLEGFPEVDAYLPSDVPSVPSVTFSTGKSWQEVASAYGKAVDEQAATAQLQVLVTKLIAGKRTREEKAAAILDYLNHEVRYTGVEFGENQIIPHSPTETLKQKYGDCKDKSTLLVAMLRTAGIPANVALLQAGPGSDISARLPGMGMFDHAIVYVPGPPALWIDATDSYARLGQLPSADQGRLALVTDAASTELTRTPESTSSDNLVLERREFFLAENGPARVVETTVPQGTVESSYRSYYADRDNEDRKKALIDYMKTQYLAEKLDRVERSDPGDFEKQFELILESLKATRGITDLQSAAVAIRLESLFARLPEELQRKEKDGKDAGADKPKAARTADYQLPMAFVTEWRYTITPPSGFQVKPLPQNVKANAGPAELTETFLTEPNGVVHAVVRFDTVKSRYTVDEATALRNQVAAWRHAEPTLISFELKAQSLLREGKTLKGFDAYRELVEMHPKESVHHLQLAEALLQQGLGGAARAEATTAVKLEPNSALAQKTLGLILEYDIVGRKFRRGSDYPGAEKALRAARKLDPEDKYTGAELGLLLEYDHDGARYGSKAPLKDAIAAYRSLTVEQLSELGFKNNPAFALFYSGQLAEAEKEARALNPQLGNLIVACEAVLKGKQEALKEANQRNSNESERQQMLRTAGLMLMNARQYAAAADLVEAGSTGENSSKNAALAAALRKTKRHEEVQPTNDPAGVITRLFLSLGEREASDATLKALYSRNALKVVDDSGAEARATVRNAGEVFRRQIRGTGASPDVALDLVLALAETRVEGSDTLGYRLTVRVSGANDITAFVVKEDGTYRLLDTTNWPTAIGLEVLDRVAAGNLDGARQFLDWMREQQHLGGGDDPVEGLIFPRFWTKGRAGDAQAMRLAAGSLLAQTDAGSPEGIRILEPAYESAPAEQKENIRVGLMWAYASTKQWNRSLTVARELAASHPDSRRVFLQESLALRQLGKYQEADALAGERLKQIPADLDALRSFMRTAATQENYELAYTREQAVIGSGKAEAADEDELAWLALMKRRVSAEDLNIALKSAQDGQNAAYILHTLGCLYVELGRTKEGREVLVQAMDAQQMDEPDDAYWYAFGRIAEQVGERTVAAEYYGKVKRPKSAMDIPESPYRLAQDRLQILQHGSGVAAAK